MKANKFLLLFHFPKNPPPVTTSPEETQAIYKQWMAWKSKFKAEILEGDGLKPGAKHLTPGVVTDGPYPESKDVIGSFTMITADSLESAVKIAQETPFLSMAGGVVGYRIEVRELAGY
jgi:hypothetical protein